MKQSRHIAIVVMAIVMMAACGQGKLENIQTEIPSNWKILKQDEYTIQYPENFELDTSGQMGIKFALLSEQASPNDLFRENINLMTEDLKGQKVSLNDYAIEAENIIKKWITNANMIENKIVKKDNLEFLRLIYTGTMGQFDLKYEQRVIFKKGKA